MINTDNVVRKETEQKIIDILNQHEITYEWKMLYKHNSWFSSFNHVEYRMARFSYYGNYDRFRLHLTRPYHSLAKIFEEALGHRVEIILDIEEIYVNVNFTPSCG